MSLPDDWREHMTRTYRKMARYYDATAYLYHLVGARERSYRRTAVAALRLHSGDTVVDLGCGTGRNFPLLQGAVGPAGRIVGVDLTDAMLAQATNRVKARGWKNVTLVQCDAFDYHFPARVNAILSTFALSGVPECGEVIAHGAAALAPGGRWAVLDLKYPQGAPGWLKKAELAALRPYGATKEYMERRSWETISDAMKARLTDLSWTEFYFGCAYLAAGTSPEPVSTS